MVASNFTEKEAGMVFSRLAAELWIKGHRDIMDNMAYAHAVKTQHTS